MTTATTYRPEAAEIATYSRRIAAALPGDWAFPDDQETRWAARIERADGLKLFLAFNTYGARMGRLEVIASIEAPGPDSRSRTLRLTEGAAPTFAALGPKGQTAEACAASIARRVLTADLEAAITANRDQAAAKARAADAFRAACAKEADAFPALLRITPTDAADRAEIRAKAPGFDLRAYCYPDAAGNLGLIYTDRSSLTLTWEALRAILTALTQPAA